MDTLNSLQSVLSSPSRPCSTTPTGRRPGPLIDETCGSRGNGLVVGVGHGNNVPMREPLPQPRPSMESTRAALAFASHNIAPVPSVPPGLLRLSARRVRRPRHRRGPLARALRQRRRHCAAPHLDSAPPLEHTRNRWCTEMTVGSSGFAVGYCDGVAAACGSTSFGSSGDNDFVLDLTT